MNVKPGSSELSRLRTQEVQPLVAILILNWNIWQDTLECLESVRQLDYSNYLAVVLDNGSSNDSAEKIKAWAEGNLDPGHVLADYCCETALKGGEAGTEEALDSTPSPARLVLVRGEENLGFSGGCNVLIRYALERKHPVDYVFLLNNDALIDKDCLDHLVFTAQAAKAGVVGALVLDEFGRNTKYPGLASAVRWLFYPLVSRHQPFPSTESDYFEVPSAHGEAMLISAATLRDVFASRGEYLNSRLFMYLDEFEFHYHTRKLGYKSVMTKRALVRHKSGASSKGNLVRLTYYQERNRILVANEILSFRMKVLFHLYNVPLLAARIVKQSVRGKRPLAWAILCGQLDGYRGRTGKWEHHDAQASEDIRQRPHD